MKKAIQFIFLYFILIIPFSCKQETKHFDEYVFAVQLVNDSIERKEYLEYHKKIWPEVENGFKKAGYHSIRLYRFDNYLTMVIKVPKGTDLTQMGATKELNTEKVKAWNALMDTYQKGLPGTSKGTTWVPMNKYYEFENVENPND